jgi:hypothetical protein
MGGTERVLEQQRQMWVARLGGVHILMASVSHYREGFGGCVQRLHDRSHGNAAPERYVVNLGFGRLAAPSRIVR